MRVELVLYASAVALRSAAALIEVKHDQDLASHDINLPLHDSQGNRDILKRALRTTTAKHPRWDDVSLAVRRKAVPGTLVGKIGNRGLFFESEKISKDSKPSVDMVKDLIVQKDNPDKKKQDMILFMLKALKLITTIVFKILEGLEGMEFELGADDGGMVKVKRHEYNGDDPISLVSWDVSDDDVHFQGNSFNDRNIISDNLRTEMIKEGLRNVTFVHVGPSGSAHPFLAYQRDDHIHYHWRPPPTSRLGIRSKKVAHHYPFFEADGAGFKISAVRTPKTTPFSKNDAAAAAAIIVKDYLSNHGSASCVGYLERQSANSGHAGHKLCYIAEMKKFELNNEIQECFGKTK